MQVLYTVATLFSKRREKVFSNILPCKILAISLKIRQPISKRFYKTRHSCIVKCITRRRRLGNTINSIYIRFVPTICPEIKAKRRLGSVKSKYKRNDETQAFNPFLAERLRTNFYFLPVTAQPPTPVASGIGHRAPWIVG